MGRDLGRFARLEIDEVDGLIAVVPEIDSEQLRAVRRPVERFGEHPFAEDSPRLSRLEIADPHFDVRIRLRSVREPRPVRGERAEADEVLDIGSICDLLGPALDGVEQVELVELVAVSIRRQGDRAVQRRDGDLPHRLFGERGQLVGPATADGNAPEVELPGDVADEEHVLPVARERQGSAEAAVRGEALEDGELRRCADGRHAADDSGYGSRRRSSRSRSRITRWSTCSVITPSRRSSSSASRSAPSSSRRRRW